MSSQFERRSSGGIQSGVDVSPEHSCSLELIQPHYCLIRNFPPGLPSHVLTSHQMIESPHHGGYVVKLSMLNSLKRFISQVGFHLPSLPNIAFKLHRTNNRTISQNSLEILYELKSKWKLEENQIRAIRFHHQNFGRVVIADQWAMGKTVTALAIVQFSKCKSVIILCPRALIANWIQHIFQRFGVISQQRDDSNCCNPLQSMNILCTCVLSLKTPTQIEFLVMCQEVALNLSQNNSQAHELLAKLRKKDMIICDEPQGFGFQQQQTRIQQGSLIPSDTDGPKLTQKSACIRHILSRCKSLLFLTDQPQKQIRTLIPLLNHKISERQMNQRYNNRADTKLQLQNIMNKYYVVRTCRNYSKPPVLLKPIVMPATMIQIESYSPLIDKYPTQYLGICIKTVEPHSDIIGSPQRDVGTQINLISSYVRFLTKKKQVREVMLIYNNPSFGKELHSAMNSSVKGQQSYELIPYNFKTEGNGKGKKRKSNYSEVFCALDQEDRVHQLKYTDQKRIFVCICRLEQTTYFSAVLKKNSRILFCELYPKPYSQRKLADFTSKLFLKCEHIEFITLPFPNSHTNKEHKEFIQPKICLDQTISSGLLCKQEYNSESHAIYLDEDDFDVKKEKEKEKANRSRYVYFDAEASDDYVAIEDVEDVGLEDPPCGEGHLPIEAQQSIIVQPVIQAHQKQLQGSRKRNSLNIPRMITRNNKGKQSAQMSSQKDKQKRKDARGYQSVSHQELKKSKKIMKAKIKQSYTQRNSNNNQISKYTSAKIKTIQFSIQLQPGTSFLDCLMCDNC